MTNKITIHANNKKGEKPTPGMEPHQIRSVLSQPSNHYTQEEEDNDDTGGLYFLKKI